MPNSSEILCQGWLIKSPQSKGIFRSVRRWRKRWFVLKAGTFPNQYLLEYYTDESAKRIKGGINLDECEQLVGPLSVQERHKYTFQIRTPERTYYLASDSESEMSKWVSSLCQVCSLKSMEEESDGGMVYSRAGDENVGRRGEEEEVASVQTRGEEEGSESDDSSPTFSNSIPCSGPYISISECFTGKPIPKTEIGDVSYCNSSVFQFPPKVNWATHPTKRSDHSDSDATPTPTPTSADAKIYTNQYHTVAPPRPPKPKKNGGSPISAGPVMTPNEKRPFIYHELEREYEMKGTYLQIQCPTGRKKEGESDSTPKLQLPQKISTGSSRKGFTGSLHPIDPSGSVEYRLIDPVKTKALNRTIEDREKQLRNNTLSKGHH